MPSAKNPAPPGQLKKAGPTPEPTPPPFVFARRPKVLFVLKKRGVGPYGGAGGYTASSGLANSTKFVVDMLVAHGEDAVLEVAIDNNDIDRLVTQHDATHVVIEALWVVPAKFEILRRLHPAVRWVVRIHSEIPFLSQEGVAMEWVLAYLGQRNVSLGVNSDRTRADLRQVAAVAYPGDQRLDDRVVFMPNYYPMADDDVPYALRGKSTIDVGCFGAVRPLKNQLIQACAAVVFADRKGLGLRLHVNAGRVEQGGGSALKNIRALFAALPARFELVEHPWLSHDDFVALVRQMDLGLQVSFSESFNIVTADFVANGVPVVVSPEVRWLDPSNWARPTDMENIVATMDSVLRLKRFLGFMQLPQRRLARYNQASVDAWLDWLEANPVLSE
jgi:hypothetical protein